MVIPETYKSQSAQDAAAQGYGDEGYWRYLDDAALANYDYYMTQGDKVTARQMLTRSLSEALSGNDSD